MQDHRPVKKINDHSPGSIHGDQDGLALIPEELKVPSQAAETV